MSHPCKGNTARLVGLLSGSLSARAADAVREHLAGCAGCARAYERLTKTAGLCRSIGEEPEPNLPWRQIETQIQWRLSRQDPKPHMWLPVLATAAAAAVAGAVLAVLFLGRPPTPSPRASAPAASAAPKGAPATEDEELAAVVTLAKGEVNVVSSRGHSAPLTLTRPLLQGDRVLVGGGQVAFQWAERSGILLLGDSEAELRLLRTARQEIVLWQGQLYAQVDRRVADRAFSVVARGIRASVKGTHFSVDLSSEAVEVQVFEGTVQVEPLNKAWLPVDVPAGHVVRVPLERSAAPRVAKGADAGVVSKMNLLPWPNFQRVMASTGLLDVESQPDAADITLDQLALGTTNLTLRAPVGRHLVELWRGGTLLRRQWIEVGFAPGRLAVDLRPKPRARPKLPEGFQEVLHLRAVQVRACYERRLKTNPALEGKLTIRIEVDKEGVVSHASLDTDTVPDPRVGQCALRALQGWRFPAGTAADLVLPFEFRPR
jgi:ferric-dicitrate binding protein FerR (iron transport regulator)